MFCKRTKKTNTITVTLDLDELKEQDKQIKNKMTQVTQLMVDLQEGMVEINKNNPNDKISDAIQMNRDTIKKSIDLCEKF